MLPFLRRSLSPTSLLANWSSIGLRPSLHPQEARCDEDTPPPPRGGGLSYPERGPRERPNGLRQEPLSASRRLRWSSIEGNYPQFLLGGHLWRPPRRRFIKRRTWLTPGHPSFAFPRTP